MDFSYFRGINSAVKYCREADLKALSDLLAKKPHLINQKNDNGNTLLHIASWRGNADMSLMLLMRGGDINATDAEGYTPLLVAVEFHHDDLAVVLLQRGANALVCNHAKCSALHIAALRGCKTVIVPLLQKGCNIDAVETNGCTPLICAIKNKNSDAALVLIEKGADLRAKDADGATPMVLAKRQGMLAVTTAIKLRFDFESTVTTRQVIREASIKAMSDRATSVGNPPSLESRSAAGARSTTLSLKSTTTAFKFRGSGDSSGSGGGNRSGVLKEEKEDDNGSRARSSGSRGSRTGAAVLSTKVTEEAIRAMTRAMQDNGGNITAAALALVNQQHAGTAAVARAFRPRQPSFADDDMSFVSSSTYNTNPHINRGGRRGQPGTLRRSGDEHGLAAIREDEDGLGGPVVRRAPSTAASDRRTLLTSRSSDRSRIRVFEDENGEDIAEPSRVPSMFCFSWGTKKPHQPQLSTSSQCLVVHNPHKKSSARNYCVIM